MVRTNIKPTTSDGGWGWMCVLGSSLSHLLISILIRSYGIFYLKFLDYYGQSASAISWVGATNMLAWGMFGPVAGALCRRFSCRTTTCIGAFLLGASIVATGFAPNFIALLILYTMAGVGMSLSYIPGYIIVGHYFDKKRATAMGLSTVGAGVAAIAYPPFLQYLFREYGYQGGMMITGAILFHAFIVAALYRPFIASQGCQELPRNQIQKKDMVLEHGKESGAHDQAELKPENEQLNSDVTDQIIPDEYATTGKCTTPMISKIQDTEIETDDQKRGGSCHNCTSAIFSQLHMLKNPVFLAMFLANVGGIFGMQVSVAFVPALAIDNGIEEIPAGLLLSVIGIADTVSRLSSGFFLDLEIVKPHRTYIFTLFVQLIGVVIICTPLHNSYAWYVCMMCLRGLFGGLFLAQRATILTDVLGQKEGEDAFGFILIANALGSVFGTISGGIVKDRFGKYGYAFYIGGSSTILTTLVLFAVLIWHYKKEKTKLQQVHMNIVGRRILKRALYNIN